MSTPETKELSEVQEEQEVQVTEEQPVESGEDQEPVAEEEEDADEPLDAGDDQENEEEEEEEEELSDIDEDAIEAPDLDEDVNKLPKFKRVREGGEEETTTRKKKTKRSSTQQEDNDDKIDGGENNDEIEEDEITRNRRLFEEKFAKILKKPGSGKRRNKNGDVDLESMQDEAISELKNLMKEAAYLDNECINNKKPAINKLKLLPQVKETLLKSNLYDSILDNNLLEAIRIWLEPLPDSSLPSFEIQKVLFQELVKLPIKTIHLRESGLGKIILFYQNCNKVDIKLKRISEKLIGDWTRPILGRSDNYKIKKVESVNFDYNKYLLNLKTNEKLYEKKMLKTQMKDKNKSLYEESADRRKRAAAPAARTSVYTVAPQVNTSNLYNYSQANNNAPSNSIIKDERFKRINQKLNLLSQKKKPIKKGGVSIEGRGLTM